MDLNKTYNNPKLEFRRKQLIKRQRAVAAMQSAKTKAIDARVEVRAAMEGRIVGPIGELIAQTLLRKSPLPGLRREPAFRLLRAVAQQADLLSTDHFRHYFWSLIRLAQLRPWWVRTPDAWRPHTHNVQRQFASLLRHLLAVYSVPGWLDASFVGIDGNETQQRWFLHVARGGNLRTAPQLPIALTKMMAHHAMHAPPGVSVTQAIRYGQARGMNVTPRMAEAVIDSRLGRAFGEADEEQFWSTVLNFLSLHAMIDPHQVAPMIDYLHAQKFVDAPAAWVNGTFVAQPPAQPGLSMHRRDPVTLMRQVDAWHDELHRRSDRHDYAWTTCGIPGYDRIEGEPGNQRRFRVTELLNSAQLRTEGAAMRHCVASYANSCRVGRAAIFSVTCHDCDGERRMLTVEVLISSRLIVQARGKFNAPSTPLDQRILSAWATTAKLQLAKFALRRAY